MAATGIPVVETESLTWDTSRSRLCRFEPVCGDVMVTLDDDNIAEVYL